MAHLKPTTNPAAAAATAAAAAAAAATAATVPAAAAAAAAVAAVAMPATTGSNYTMPAVGAWYAAKDASQQNNLCRLLFGGTALPGYVRLALGTADVSNAAKVVDAGPHVRTTHRWATIKALQALGNGATVQEVIDHIQTKINSKGLVAYVGQGEVRCCLQQGYVAMLPPA